MNIFLDANICLDLLDSKRPTSKESIDWYMNHKDNELWEFYFSSDFITTFYYVLAERRKYDASKVIASIEALSLEIFPHYLTHSDFIHAKRDFFEGQFKDFEDLMILNSVIRGGCELFVTNDKNLLELKEFHGIKIERPIL
ncbi:MAG: PIN domain-containing protein [Epsilonproteobacteria bacterium]|nr:PIN domain-containing protein [Campylobacterota bacterium]